VRSGFGYAWPPIRGDLFHRVVKLELLVLRSDPMPGALHEQTVVRVELDDHGDKTRMTLIDGPFLGAAAHVEAGYNAAFDKFATLLAAA
jgi:hypothetical protein